MAKLTSERQWKVSVSFEFDLQPVATWKGVVTAGSSPVAARRALLAAKKANKSRNPRSIVVVLETAA